ncbi:Swi5-domain-containing protein [Glomus cerebriforme]|uniref:Swi5-domain-containing protein n=1 Tax=Glomus cerebriforme TaxID=658196 RepID=A0A397TG19_9GLOM|nr:Swi5-domain-containing protein [Glomus cerebriforme]
MNYETMNDIKSKKERALSYIIQEGNTRPVSVYELNKQLGDSTILQELVTEGIILEKKVEVNGFLLDIPLDTVTLYFNKIEREKDDVSIPILKSNLLGESNLQMNSKSVDLNSLNSQIQSLKNQLYELNNVELKLKKKLRGNLDVQKTLNDHYRQLHEYNEIKDVGQMLLGKCAEIEGTTTREMYKKFGLELND